MYTFVETMETEMDILDYHKDLAKLIDRMNEMESRFTKVRDLENRIVSIEGELQLLGLQQKVSKSILVNELTANVSALVGLREAMASKRRPVRIAWAILLFLGTAATLYYVVTSAREYVGNKMATNVALHRHATYNYPSVVLCAGSWVDTPKALSKGLTKEALAYSLGYLDRFVADRAINVTRARKTFHEFYKKQNYSGLLDYYRDITIDLSPYPPYHNHSEAAPVSFYECKGCNESSPVEKIIVMETMCYAFSLKTANAHRVHTWDTAPVVQVQVEDRSQGITSVSPNWYSYLTADRYMLQPSFPPISLEQLTFTTLKTSAQYFHQLSNEAAGCLEKEEVKPGYSPERCAIKCLHKLRFDEIGCGIFPFSAFDEFRQPSHYCNFFEKVPSKDITYREFYDSVSSLADMAESGPCISKCKYPCERTVYTSTMDSKFKIEVDSTNWTSYAIKHKMQAVAVRVDNTALSQGGVLTLTEVNTYSFTTLVSNVGGTLGLFIGATVFTLFQVFFVVVNYILDVNEKCQPSGRVTDVS